jgi:hypothetical protein
MPDIWEKILKEQQQTNIYLKLIAGKVHSIESEIVMARLQHERKDKIQQ